MNRNTLAAVFACIMLAVCMSPILVSDDSSADRTVTAGDIHAHTFTDGISMGAGSTRTFEIELYNSNASDTYQVAVLCSLSDSSHMKTSCSLTSISVNAGKTATATVTVDSDRVAAGSRTLTVTVKAMDITTGAAETSGSFDIPVNISSKYASDGYYNRIMGMFESPIDSPPVNAAITLGIWVAIAFAVDFLLMTALRIRASKDSSDDGLKDAKSAGRFLFVLIILIGAPQAMMVAGMSEDITSVVTDFVEVIMALVIALIVWPIYKVVMYNIIVTRDKNNKIDDSLFPLVKMIGKTIILIALTSYILAVFGMDLATIVTSAGIVTLAVSLGAQSTLNQFFCGIVLLTTRPFRIGDKVRLGTNPDVLIVRKIGVMETEFKVWLNEEVQHIPNSTVMASNIFNITKDDKTYKVVDYIDIDYKADIDRARDIIMSILASHPRIVNDGSKSKPDFRFSSMENSAIRIRISYIVNDHEVYHLVSCQIKEMIYRKFVAEGIKVPYHVIDVHMRD